MCILLILLHLCSTPPSHFLQKLLYRNCLCIAESSIILDDLAQFGNKCICVYLFDKDAEFKIPAKNHGVLLQCGETAVLCGSQSAKSIPQDIHVYLQQKQPASLAGARSEWNWNAFFFFLISIQLYTLRGLVRTWRCIGHKAGKYPIHHRDNKDKHILTYRNFRGFEATWFAWLLSSAYFYCLPPYTSVWFSFFRNTSPVQQQQLALCYFNEGNVDW